MVAIVSGNSLGLSLTSLTALGDRFDPGMAANGRAGEHAYVNIASGNLVLRDDDEHLAGRGIDIDAVRVYNSQGKFNDDNGDNWALGSYRREAVLTPGVNGSPGAIVRTGRDGAESTYAWNAAKNCYLSSDGDGAHDSFVVHGDRLAWTDGRIVGAPGLAVLRAGRRPQRRQLRMQRLAGGIGQLTRIDDVPTQQMTLYSYDLGGRRIREHTQRPGVVYQDNYLAYDALGWLRWVGDGHASVAIDYDKAGNRTRIRTRAYSGDTGGDSDRHFQYDAMHRQTVVDAVDAGGALGAQGHRLTYDLNGNRSSDTWEGNKAAYRGGKYVATPGPTTETYEYDALNRLSRIRRDGVAVDARFYDAASRLLQSGPGGALAQDYAKAIGGNGGETRVNYYDPETRRLRYQRVFNSDNTPRHDIDYNAFDSVGNLLRYFVINPDGSRTTYTYSMVRLDGYRQNAMDGTSPKGRTGATVNSYDANGHLIGIDDHKKNENDRRFVNDAQGHALYVNQNGHVQRQLVVDGEVLGRYGEGIDEKTPRDGGGNPRFTAVADFSFGYRPVSGAYPAQTPAQHIVGAGDTLASIAQAAYGDSRQWYLIADANGLSGSGDLTPGQSLRLPNRVAAMHNGKDSVAPYDASRITGDTTPHLPMPHQGKGCGGMGTVLIAVVAIAATILTTGAAAFLVSGNLATASLAQVAVAGLGGMTGAFGVGVMAAGAVGGGIASQGMAMAMDMQDRFDWKGVALSAIGSGVSGGMAGWAPTGNVMADMAIRAAAGNAFTQGVGMTMGLQSSSSWRGVAASAAGAGTAAAVGQGLQGVLASGLGKIGASAAASVAGGLAAAALRGGRANVARIAADAFGNAIRNSVADNLGRGSQQEQALGKTFAEDGVARKAANYWNPESDNHALEMARFDGQATAELALHGSLDMVRARPVPDTVNGVPLNNTALNVVGKTADGGWRWDTGGVSYPVDLSYPESRPLPSVAEVSGFTPSLSAAGWSGFMEGVRGETSVMESASAAKTFGGYVRTGGQILNGMLNPQEIARGMWGAIDSGNSLEIGAAALGFMPIGTIGKAPLAAEKALLQAERGVAIGGNSVREGLAYRVDLPDHLFGPAFTKSGMLDGTHNLQNATAALDAKGATYALNPTGTNGIYELEYSYTNAAGKLIEGRPKTVYDPTVLSNQAMLNHSMQAGELGWQSFLTNPAQRTFDISQGGVNFRVYINTDKYGNNFVGNVHPIK